MKPPRFFFLDYSQDPFQKHPQHFFAPLEIGYCLSILKKNNHKVSFLDLRIDRRSIEETAKIIKNSNADIILLKPTTATKSYVLKIAALLRDGARFIYCYGQTATLWPEMFLYPDSPIDGCLLGEIENNVLNLASLTSNHTDFRTLKGIAYFGQENNSIIRKGGAPSIDIDSFPFPDHSIFFNRKYSFGYPVKTYKRMKVAYMLSSRGCPEKCAFCSILRRSSYGKIYRGRSWQSVLTELKQVLSLGFNTVYFIDDNFSYDKQRVMDICNKIIEEGINKRFKWVAQCSIKSLDSEMIQIMKNSGCSTVCLGIESANKGVLEKLAKPIDLESINSTIKELQKAKIMIVVFFIIGNPFESRADILQTIRFCRKINPDMLQLHYCSIYPDSPLFKNNSSTKVSLPYECDRVFNPSLVNGKSLNQLYSYFYRSHYLNCRTIFSFLKKQSLTYLINWEERAPFFLRSMGYIFGIK